MGSGAHSAASYIRKWGKIVATKQLPTGLVYIRAVKDANAKVWKIAELPDGAFVSMQDGRIVYAGSQASGHLLLELGPKLSLETLDRITPKAMIADSGKEERFSLVANMMAKTSGIVVKESDQLDCPSVWYPSAKVIQIHPNMPECYDSEFGHILDKAKLFHELSHAIFTRHEKERDACMQRSKAPQLFAILSNCLEDGRIERLFKKAFAGADPYLRAKAAELALQFTLRNKHPINDLKAKVYLGRYLTPEGKALWSPFDALIEGAVAARSSKDVWKAAEELTNALADQLPPVQSSSRCWGVDKDAKKPLNPKDAPDSKESQDSKEQSGGGVPSAGPSQPGDGAGEPHPADGMGSGPEADGPLGGDGVGGPNHQRDGEDITEPALRKAWEDIKKLKSAAISETKIEVAQELESLRLQDLERTSEYQDLLESEDAEAQELAETLRNWRIEARRTKYKTVRHGGCFDSRRQVAALTDQPANKSPREPGEFDFDSVIILDDSSSMDSGDKYLVAASVARILVAALRKARLLTQPIMLNRGAVPVIPLSGLGGGAGTPTHHAFESALEILEASPARRKVVFLITDGAPDNLELTREAWRSLDEAGVTVFGIGIGTGVNPQALEQQCHIPLLVKDVADLRNALPQMLLDFAEAEVYA